MLHIQEEKKNVTLFLRVDIQMNDDNLTPEKNTPLAFTKNPPLALVAQDGCIRDISKRRYTAAQAINELAITKFRPNGKGVTYTDLMEAGLAKHKKQAQDTLKYCLQIGTLFTLRDCRPQEYYPSVIKSEVMTKQLSKNTPIDPTGVTYSKHPLSNCLEPLTIQTLEGFVLPLLPSAPLFVHNLHFKVKISRKYYSELNLKGLAGNNGKRHAEIIGKACVNYTYYPSGTVNVEVQCSNNPFRLSDEADRARLHVFFGQIRDRMITFLVDMHERVVPDIMEWCVTECDINKDTKVSDLFHFSAVKIQVKHLDRLFRIYIKSMGQDTVCRVEASLHPNKSAIKVIDDVFNPAEGIERMVGALKDKVTEMHSMISHITETIVPCVPIQHPIRPKDTDPCPINEMRSQHGFDQSTLQKIQADKAKMDRIERDNAEKIKMILSIAKVGQGWT